MKKVSERSAAGRYHRFAPIAVLGAAALLAACANNGTSGEGATASSTSTTASTGTSTTSSSGANGSGTTTNPAVTPALTSALTSAYRAETAALATYRNVIAALGSTAPFSNIEKAEQQHVSTLSALFARYGIAVPTAGTGQTSPSTRTAACQLGVTVEEQTISLYTTQLPNVSAYPDVTTAFQNLLTASQDDHLPAFQHCA